MDDFDVSRRALLKGGAALSGALVLQVASPAAAFADDGDGDTGDDLVSGAPSAPGVVPSGTVLPWLDQPAPVPDPAKDVVGNLLVWEDLETYFTPSDNFFTVKHYDLPAIDAASYRLSIEGMVDRPRTYTLDELRARARRAVDFTLECSGNTGLPFFIGGVGNARWAGTPLRSLLREACLQDGASEVVFWGADSGKVTIRDDGGVTSAGMTGETAPDDSGGLDLTITEQFARSMSVDDAMSRENLLCYEMNDVPLPPEHGFPVRLIAPGWYGVANVKWLNRIEVIGQRYTGRFMARDSVTLRETERPDGSTVWTFQNVGHDRLKSAPAKVIRQDDGHVIFGVAWGAPIDAVEVRIDDGPWQQAELVGPSSSSRRGHGFAWRFWSLRWPSASSGDHTVTSRAIDTDGNVQPAADDPLIADKHTYWESNGQITRRVHIG
jgi:DMSO/TMAO reductase YedYZ molybdopterin-dependent catalytic subunit